jgi:23S rRNA (uracil1939-C5)-methyltransferase
MAFETVTIDTYTYGGESLGRLADGRAVFVPHTIPGEKVRVEIVLDKPRYAKAKLLEILETVPERIHARCPHYTVCGGCHYQHLKYDAQLKIKADNLYDQLIRIGKLEEPIIEDVIPSPQPWHYRNHVQFHIASEGGLGFQATHSQGVIPIDECHVLTPAIDQLWPQIEIEAISGLEQVSIRMGSQEDLMIVLESIDPEPFSMDLDLSISVIHRGPNGFLVLAGDDYVVTEVKGRVFRISAGSSFRVNPVMSAEMIEHIVDGLPLTKNSTLLNAYAGVGFFSAFLAPHVGRLVAIEASSSACEDFSINLDEYDHVELYEAPVEHALPALEFKPDFIVAGPPRSGLAQNVLDGVLSLAPETLVYISSDPSTLARDAQRLTQGGYRLQSITPFDLFPQTYHIESISFWEKA